MNSCQQLLLLLLLMQTCAARKVGNVGVFEDLRVLDHLGQTPQARAAHDSHSGPHLRVGQQPVCCGAALLIGVPENGEG